MTGLQRITTVYCDEQDRLRLSGEQAQGQVIVLWMTQRLTNRLVAHLCEVAGAGAADSLASQLQRSFELQVAAASLVEQPPVQPTCDAAEALVYSVDVTSSQSGARLVFKGSSREVLAELGLPHVPLQQWLGIVHGQYRSAQWPMAVWPAWVEEAQSPAPRPSEAVWH